MKLVMTLLVRDEEDIVNENIAFHLNQGVDHIIATDNGSCDSTRSILLKYQDAGVLTLLDEPGRDHSQWRWVTRMAVMARDVFNADWVLNNDADEFWVCNDFSLRDFLETNTSDIINVQRKNLCFAWDANNTGHWLDFVKYRMAEPLSFTRPSDILNPDLPAPYFCLDLPTKALLRTQGLTKVWEGNHSGDFDRKAMVSNAPESVCIYHFPIRSKQQFLTKAVNGGGSYARNTELPLSYGWHQRYWYDLIQKGKIEQALSSALPDQAYLDTERDAGRIIEDQAIKMILDKISR
ncbi:MAG: glycosyltransferase family 2 protein [Pseudoruegeria sp.]